MFLPAALEKADEERVRVERDVPPHAVPKPTVTEVPDVRAEHERDDRNRRDYKRRVHNEPRVPRAAKRRRDDRIHRVKEEAYGDET